MVVSSEKQKQIDKDILLIIKTFLEKNCRVTDKELEYMLNISSSTIGRYMNSNRAKELIGIDNFAYIKRERLRNKEIGRKKGGSRKKNG